jgi:hypothetical protein
MAESNDIIESLRQLVATELDTINTAIPCKVVSYSGGRVSVKPQGEKKYSDGDKNAFPVISNLRFVWPAFAGGRAGVKGPVLAGDDCLLIACQQAIDDDDYRRFDLVDAYVIPGGGYSDNIPGNSVMQIYFGESFISLNESGEIIINAPRRLTVNSPESTFNGKVTVMDSFAFMNGMTGTGGAGAVATFTGQMDVTGDVVVNGISYKGHKHKENGDGGGITDAPIN